MGLGHLWRKYVVQTVREAEHESLSHYTHDGSKMSASLSRPVEYRVIVVCIVVAINLTLLQYFGLSDKLHWIQGAFTDLGLSGAAEWFEQQVHGDRSRLFLLCGWALSCVFLYFIIPALVVRYGFRESLADYGLGLKGAFGHLKIYILLFLIVLPLVIGVSFSERFQRQYPFYQTYGSGIPPGFVYWEMAYAVQFFALEFFFRGFMLHGLKRRFGFYAIFVTMVPYCMIHFGKPFPETIGAIVAGFALGVLSLRTGAIWLGFLIHVSVALSMDVLALWQKGLL